MTDDFQLFPDAGGGEAIDADISLITAYLARELSLVQVAAVEDRLATDAAFREKVSPIIDAWMVPGSYGPARQESLAKKWEKQSLASEEVEAGWQRYRSEAGGERVHARPRLLDASRTEKTQRRKSMTRIAAVITAIVLPVVTVAQVVAYVAKHPDAPGHSVAQTIAAPFIDVQAPAPPPQKTTDLRRPDDTPISKQLQKAPLVKATAPVTAPLTAVTTAPAAPTPVETPAPAATPNPDRARIVALVKENQPALVRGDTTASYVLVILDASDKYLWSTFGTGSLSIEVAGDKRSFQERATFTRTHQAEYGPSFSARGGAGGGGGGRGGGFARGAAADTSRVVARATIADTAALVRMLDSARRVVTTGRGGGGTVTTRDDSVLTGRLVRRDTALAGRARGTYASGVGGGVAGGVAIGGLIAMPPGFGDSSGVYRANIGPMIVIDGQVSGLNDAFGLQQPGKGESGVQGLASSKVTMAETYSFVRGELTAAPIRVAVLHLAAGTTWKRF